ncbi:hypothetical protein ACFLU6_11560 [Acidobacteriota bacterium]
MKFKILCCLPIVVLLGMIVSCNDDSPTSPFTPTPDPTPTPRNHLAMSAFNPAPGTVLTGGEVKTFSARLDYDLQTSNAGVLELAVYVVQADSGEKRIGATSVQIDQTGKAKRLEVTAEVPAGSLYLVLQGELRRGNDTLETDRSDLFPIETPSSYWDPYVGYWDGHGQTDDGVGAYFRLWIYQNGGYSFNLALDDGRNWRDTGWARQWTQFKLEDKVRDNGWYVVVTFDNSWRSTFQVTNRTHGSGPILNAHGDAFKH